MSAFTPIPSLDQLDFDAFIEQCDREEELVRNGQNEPPEPAKRYPGFVNIPSDILRQIVADPWPLAEGDDPDVMREEARDELDRRHPPTPSGYAEAICARCKTAIYVQQGTGNPAFCPRCAPKLVA